MTTLIKIGNSQGIRVPKALIKQAHLENADLEFEIVENGLLIKPVKNTGREDWAQNIQKVLSAHKNTEDEAVLDEFLNDSDLEEHPW